MNILGGDGLCNLRNTLIPKLYSMGQTLCRSRGDGSRGSGVFVGLTSVSVTIGILG